MTHLDRPVASDGPPPWWRLVVIALGTLALCSCRWHSRQAAEHGPPVGPGGLPPQAWTGMPAYEPPAAAWGPPLPYHVQGPWSPPGLETPWPRDEYLRDGGDAGRPVAVSPDWEVHGLDLEDTVAHYDSLDGRTLVEPSNRVHIYAPRFASVRLVSSVIQTGQAAQPGGVVLPVSPARHEDAQGAVSSLQRLQPRGDVAATMAGAYETRQQGGAISSALTSRGFQDSFLPFEDLAMIRHGLVDQAEKARLAIGIQAAIVWTHDQAVHVILDHQAASEITGDQRAEAVYSVKDLRDSPKLRVIKVASTQLAQPGDEIDFTLRFDNVGDQPLGNIVLVDNLTTRLEYVADSAQSSVAAEFSSTSNEAESLVLRWEITEPIEPGQGGIVRFRCRVR